MNSFKVNPLGFAYTSTVGLEAYSEPSAMLVTGRDNRYSQNFATARDRGAEVFAYLNVVERPDKAYGPVDLQSYMGDVSRVPLWVPPRINFAGQVMTDMRVGSAWIEHCLVYLEALILERTVDGVFLDVVGDRLWSKLAAWDTWPQSERDEWTVGNVDFLRRLDQVRRSVDDEFKIVINNLLELPAAIAARMYVDGVCIEHHPSSRTSVRAAVGRAYSTLGHRRVLWIANGLAEAQAVAAIEGVTHVSEQLTYGRVTSPPVPFNDLRLPEALARNARLQARNSELAAEKRAKDEQLDRVRTHVGALVAELTR